MSRPRILVVGVGSIGERHARCFQRTQRVDVAICEPREDVRQRVAQDYGLTHVFAELEDALRQDFAAAVLCIPAHLHIPFAMRFLERNIPLLIEKPLSVSEDGVDALIRVAQERAVPVSVAYVHRANPALQAMKTALESGRFGELVQLTVVSGQHFPFYRPAYREIYYRDRAKGGGAIQDSLTHMVNAAEWLVGPVTRLVADAEHCVLEGVDVEDTVHLVARHGQLLANYSLNQHQPVNETSLTVMGTRGVARLEFHRVRWLSCTEPNADWIVEQTYPLERDDLFVRQAEAFLDLLEGRAAPACTLAEGLQTMRVNLAALQSVEDRQWVSVAQ
jgi:predicted dehydrogenase